MARIYLTYRRALEDWPQLAFSENSFPYDEDLEQRFCLSEANNLALLNLLQEGG
jgi:hypothetical protein